MSERQSGKVSYFIPAAFSVAMSLVVLGGYAAKLAHADAKGGLWELQSTSPQPSFPCDQVRWASEIAICKSPKLATLDSQMAELYGSLIKSHPELRLSQRLWIQHRNNNCRGNQPCIERMLNERIAEFNRTQSSGQ